MPVPYIHLQFFMPASPEYFCFYQELLPEMFPTKTNTIRYITDTGKSGFEKNFRRTQNKSFGGMVRTQMARNHIQFLVWGFYGQYLSYRHFLRVEFRHPAYYLCQRKYCSGCLRSRLCFDRHSLVLEFLRYIFCWIYEFHCQFQFIIRTCVPFKKHTLDRNFCTSEIRLETFQKISNALHLSSQTEKRRFIKSMTIETKNHGTTTSKNNSY